MSTEISLSIPYTKHFFLSIINEKKEDKILLHFPSLSMKWIFLCHPQKIYFKKKLHFFASLKERKRIKKSAEKDKKEKGRCFSVFWNLRFVYFTDFYLRCIIGNFNIKSNVMLLQTKILVENLNKSSS